MSNRAFTIHFSSCVHCDVELEENYDSKQKQYKWNKNKADKTILSSCSSQQKLSGKIDIMVTIKDIRAVSQKISFYLLLKYNLIVCISLETADFTNLNESNRGSSSGGTMPEYLKLYSTKDKSIYYPFDKNDAYVQTSDVENCLGTSHGRNMAFRDLIIVVVLSLHAVFEGLAIGLENHSADIWILFAGKIFSLIYDYILNILKNSLQITTFRFYFKFGFNFFGLIAVATHKFVISFCVGLELYNANTPTIVYAIYMSIFSLMTPIGVGVGIAITSAVTQDATPYMVTVGVLQVMIMNFGHIRGKMLFL